MTVALRVYEEGAIVFDDPEFARIGLNDTFEVAKESCPELSRDRATAERLVVADCTLGDERGTFSQEHQLVYENPANGFLSGLLYDQRPAPKPGSAPSPIILMAPKVWVSRRINTLIAFASASPLEPPGLEDQPLEITVFSGDGRVIATCSKRKPRNSVWILDVRELVEASVSLTDEPMFLTVAGRGGAGCYAITTFVVVDSSGTFALEHSLPPPYYTNGDMRRVRREANLFHLNGAYGSRFAT
jgi:hypothetical protein